MTASHLRSDLQSSRDALFSLLRGLSEEQFRHAPQPGDWNIAAHLAHLLRSERVVAARAALALRGDESPVKSTGVSNDDDPAVAQHLAVPQMIHGLQASRRDLLAVLDAAEGAGAGALDGAIIHERLGRMTVASMMQKQADHEREHAADVSRLASQAAAASRVALPLTERPQPGAR